MIKSGIIIYLLTMTNRNIIRIKSDNKIKQNMYCKCGNTVHPVRLELGYKNCVSCSNTKTYSYVPIITHKTGNTIQIVSQEVSASVHKAWRRK